MQSLTMAGRDWLLLVTLSVLWGGSFFFSEVALGELGPFTVVLGRVGIAAVALVAFVYLSGRRMPGALTWAAVLGLALLSTALAYLIYFRILAAIGATNLLLVTFLIPVSALLLGTFVLGERPDAAAFAGMALIFAGLAAVDGRLFARLRGGGARRSPGRERPRSRPG